MSKFGWDLPPGCTQRQIDEAFGGSETCECCGYQADDCICPECPVCGAVGDPKCYTTLHVEKAHGMEYNKSQYLGQAKLRVARLKDELSYEELAIDYLETEIEQERQAEERARKREADRIDGYDRDDLGESPDY